MAFAFGGPGGQNFNLQDLGQLKELAELGQLGELGELGEMGIPMPPAPPAPPRQKKLGLKIQDTEEGGNVKIIDVDDSSAAATAGLKKDDLITEINGEKITNTDEARENLHPEEGKSTYKIKVLRAGKPLDFEVKIPKKLKTANL